MQKNATANTASPKKIQYFGAFPAPARRRKAEVSVYNSYLGHPGRLQDALVHDWAHQLKEEAKASNLWFEGTELYSYDMLIGDIVYIDDTPIYLINSGTHSPITSAHIEIALHAVPLQAEKVYFPVKKMNLDEWRPKGLPRGKRWDFPKDRRTVKGEDAVIAGNALVRHLINMAMDCARHYIRARTDWSKESWIRNANDKLAQADRIKSLTLATEDIPTLESLIPVVKDLDRESLKQARIENKRRAEAYALRQAQIVEDNKDDREAFISGDPRITRIPGPVLLRPVMLEDRMDADNPRDHMLVQTSRGVTVPYDHARRTWRILKAVDRRKKIRDPHIQVGHYSVDEINSDGVIIGCHHIDWPEIDRFAKQEGWA
jgi:hypothetical protein